MTEMTSLIEVEPISSDRFRAVIDSPLSRPTIFGGSMLAQSLRASAATVDGGKVPHSLHATFLRAGQAGGGNVEVRVTRTRDGRNFSTRQSTLYQGERDLMLLTSSYKLPEAGLEFQSPIATDVPTPDELLRVPATTVTHGPAGSDQLVVRAGTREDPRWVAWMKVHGALGEDPVLHYCALAAMSDGGPQGVIGTAVGVVAGGPDRESGPHSVRSTSLDHSVWFHRPLRADQWLLIDGRPLSTADGRGVVVATVHDLAGRHVASFTQEMMLQA